MEQGKSAWTLTTERSALRLFFQDGQLTDGVALPRRRREDIKRSCQPAVRDKHIKETIPERGQTECLIGRVSLGALSSAFNKQALRG